MLYLFSVRSHLNHHRGDILILDMFFRHLVTLFLIILFSIKLWSRKSFKDMETKFFWVPVISCFLLIIEDMLESYAAQDPAMRVWRILFSVLGYNFRCDAAVGMLLVIAPQDKRKPALWIPCAVNLLLCSTAFFSDIVFGFDETYDFVRGPLGIVPFIVPIFYMLLILWYTFRYIMRENGIEKWIPPVCVVFCLAASVADALAGGIRINEAIMICTVFFYIFLYSHDNRLDPLTGSLNRQAYYDDCKALVKNIGAVASLDMNGLKELNDGQGHQAGDEALKCIGKCISNVIGHDTQAYRTGGDEFMLLFFQNDENEIAEIGKRIKERVSAKGYHISIGYAMLDGETDLDGAISISDKLMYEDKDRYYRETGKDRRMR